MLTKKDLASITTIVRTEVRAEVTKGIDFLAKITKEGFDGVDERFDKLEARMDKVETGLTGVERSNTKLGGKVNVLINVLKEKNVISEEDQKRVHA